MPPQTRQHKIHDVEITQTQLQGKWYTTVDGRVKIAEHADPKLIRRDGSGYHVVEVKILPIGERWAYHCMVEYPIGSGVIKPGSDFIDMKDNTGLAKAETSAIGRALGLHGIAIEESIASLDEMANVPEMKAELSGKNETTQRTHQQTSAAPPSRPTQPPRQPSERQKAATVQTGADAMATDRQVANIKNLCRALNRPEPDFTKLTFPAAKTLLTTMSEDYNKARQGATA